MGTKRHENLSPARYLWLAGIAWILQGTSAKAFPSGQQEFAPAPKSIHQIEAEAHRNLVVRPALSARRTRSLPPSVLPNRERTVFGFYPYWAPGFSEIRFHDLTHLAVFSVEADGSGQLVNVHGWPNAPLIQAAHDANVRVVLVCTLFDPIQLDSLLSSAVAQQALIGNLEKQILAGAADGINIDFEGVPGRLRANLVLFVKELAIRMRAAVPGAHVSLDTPAVDWSNAFDYAALADICDALMIMGYDYYWSGSPYAGPVAPLTGSALWGPYSVQWTIADYLAKMGTGRSGKLLLGVPYYGYDWPAVSDALHAGTLGKATARTYTDARNQALSYGQRWDAAASAPWYAYVSQNWRQTWYEDPASLTLKYDMVFGYGLQGIGIWALTYDRGTGELWQLIEQRFAPAIAPDPPELTAPPVFFDIAGLPIAIRPQGIIRAARFEVAVGTSPGGTEISNFVSVGLRKQVLLQGFQLQAGVTYYLTARSIGEQGAAGLAGPSASITLDTSLPVNRKYLPHWISTTSLYTGLALLNTMPSTRAFLMRGYVTGRQDPILTSWVLKPGQQLAELVAEDDFLGAAATGSDGWLEISYGTQDLRSMYAIGDSASSRSLDGGPLLDSSSQQVFGQLDGGHAVIEIVNPNVAMASLILQLFTAGGPSTLSLNLPARSFYAARVSDMFAVPFASQSMPADFIVLKSDLPVACGATLQTNNDSAAVPAMPVSRAAKAAAFSYVVWGAGYETEVALINPSGEAVIVSLQLSGAGRSDPIWLELPPGSGRNLTMSELFGNPGSASMRGSLTVGVTGGSGVVGSAWLRTTDYRIMAALPLEIPDSSFVFPYWTQTRGYWTGLSMTNADSAPNHVTVEALDANGNSLGINQRDLAPGEQNVALLYQWIAATTGAVGGSVQIRSTGPLLATEIFGSDTLSFMMVVPGR